MELQSRYFGVIEYEDKECLSFPNGLFGFETEHSFLLLPFEGSGGTLLCLQSTQTPALAFVVMDPFALYPEYAPVLQRDDLKFLDVTDSERLCYYVLCMLKSPVSESTVNLKCPIVINPESLKSCQIILDTDVYEMRHQLTEFAAKTTDAPNEDGESGKEAALC